MCSTASCGAGSRIFCCFTSASTSGRHSTWRIRRLWWAAVCCSSICFVPGGRRPMYPEIFHISFLHTYGVLVAAAFLTSLWMAGRLARRKGLNVDAVTNLGIYCALAAIAGAKLMMFVVDFGYYREHPGEVFSRATLQAGGVFYGGLLAALAISWWYMRKTRLPMLETADVFAPAVALGHGIGRLGCFAAG